MSGGQVRCWLYIVPGEETQRLIREASLWAGPEAGSGCFALTVPEEKDSQGHTSPSHGPCVEGDQEAAFGLFGDTRLPTVD